MTSDLFMLVTSNIYQLCLATADHLLFEVPQMNAVPIMSRTLYHITADHYSVWLLQTASSSKFPR
jgi:hypothetical protein